MNKKKLIIIASSIVVIALVLFLFWDKVKALFNKPTEDNKEEIPPIVVAAPNGNTGVTGIGTKTPPAIVVTKPKRFNVLKAATDTYIFKAGANNTITSTIAKAVKAGASVGIYMPEHDLPNYYYVNVPNGAPGFVKKSTVTV